MDSADSTPAAAATLEEILQRQEQVLMLLSRQVAALTQAPAASSQDAVEADGVYKVLEKNMETQLDQVKREVEELTMEFEPLLAQWVQTYGTSEDEAKSFLDHAKVITLRSVIDKKQPKTENNLNIKLASCLTNSIDEKFQKYFSNNRETGSLIEVISRFSLDTHLLIPKYKAVEEQMKFLQTRENKIKAKINTIIIKEKDAIYNSLSETIAKNMERGYDAARRFSQPNEANSIRDTIKAHLETPTTTTMYDEAKTTMMGKINTLKITIYNELKGTMEYFIKLLFKADVRPLPEVKKRERNDSTVP